MEASEYGIEKESRGRLRQTIVESDQDSSRTGFDGRPVRQICLIPTNQPMDGQVRVVCAFGDGRLFHLSAKVPNEKPLRARRGFGNFIIWLQP